ncbi:hypothetical protein OH491_05285 [Termitidicoccus mucosus]|uniref:Uncharacterized protein n=1 Tax=Termitidicoccus mucosus TaxID=1184151 RepID=A0A178IGY5_9BACT|nr:hypothetical protein AW736_19670 [Opitutaceae bacterium TSB47]
MKMTINRFVFSLAAVVATGVAFAVSGCSKSEKKHAADDAEHVASRISEMAGDAWASVKDATFEQRSAFVAGVSKTADDFEATSKGWGAQLNTLSGDAKSGAQSALNDFNTAVADLRQKLKGADGATAETWASVKAGIQSAWTKAQEAYVRAKESFAGK